MICLYFHEVHIAYVILYTESQFQINLSSNFTSWKEMAKYNTFRHMPCFFVQHAKFLTNRVRPVLNSEL